MKLQVVDGRVVNPEGLEINATFHCNMRCTSCSHLAPLYRRTSVDPAAVHDMLGRLAGGYHASYTKILGGEPLLHPDLLGLIGAVRDSGVSDTVLVCTNGTLLDRAPGRFWEAVDAVEVSVYPSRPLSDEDVARFQGVAREHGVAFEVNFYEYFRVAYSEPGTVSRPLVRDIFDTCKLAHLWLAHTAHDGWFYRCPQSIVLAEQLTGQRWDHTVDGIEIHDDPGFVERLAEFVNRETPLRACRNCLGSIGRLHPHTEVPRGQWRQTARTEELVDHDYLQLSKQDISLDDGCVTRNISPTTGSSA